MKRTRILAYIFNLYSMSAVAGYECTLKLANNNDMNTIVAEKTLAIAPGTMKSGNMGTLYVEFENRRKIISLDINAVMRGWEGDENATFVMIRRTKTRFTTKSSTVSEIMTIKGEDYGSGIFDSYKLDISCKITETI